MKRALVTGYTGQDGTFLTDLLLKKGYKVIGLVRRVSTEPPGRVRGQFDFSEAIASKQLELEQGDLLSVDSLIRIIKKHQPQEVYNLAAQSDVHISFTQPEFTINADFMGVVNLIAALEAVNKVDWRMYQASTSEMFGTQQFLARPQHNRDYDHRDLAGLSEDSAFYPNSPYSIAKAAAHYYCQSKRQQGRFIACGILFNHESEIRGGNFVTQKIARSIARLPDQIVQADGPQLELVRLELGNLESVRDWGYAGDYVEAMWKMLQIGEPDDFVIGTGQTHTVRQFVEAAVRARDMTIEWRHEGKQSEGYIQGKLFVVVSDKYWRNVDVTFLKADAAKAEKILDWRPKVTFNELVQIMVEAQELELFK